VAWYLRKALRLGPLRLNLSRSGVGVSAGVKGLRVGVGAKGRRYLAGGRGGLYFRQYLGDRAAGPPAPDVVRWRVILWTVVAVSVGVVLLVALSHAGERAHVSLYDSQGRRTGYAIVDRESGRVDVYDTQSNRTGYGTVDRSTGRVELFDVGGRRLPGALLPVLPPASGRR
jgi:hypothetical protein